MSRLSGGSSLSFSRLSRRLMWATVFVLCALAAAAADVPDMAEIPAVAIVPIVSATSSEGATVAIASSVAAAIERTGLLRVIGPDESRKHLKSAACAEPWSRECGMHLAGATAADHILAFETSLGADGVSASGVHVEVGQFENPKRFNHRAPSLDEAVLYAELLAYRYVLTFLDPPDAEDDRRDMVIDTVPRGAALTVDGRTVGRSPAFLADLSQQHVIVEARAGPLYLRRSISLDPGLNRQVLKLEPTFGHLFVKSDAVDLAQLSIKIDGRPRGEISDGIITDVPIGTRRLVVSGSGYYWSGTVDVPFGRTVEVPVAPRPVGEITYRVPDGATATIARVGGSGEDAGVASNLTGSGTLFPVDAGRYRVSVAGSTYVPFSSEFEIHRGNTYELTPELVRTRVYYEETFTSELAALARALNTANPVDDDLATEAVALSRAIADAPYEYTELALNAQLLVERARDRIRRQRVQSRLSSLRTEQAVLSHQVEQAATAAHRVQMWRIVTLGTGVGGAGLWAIFSQAGNTAYTRYLTASVTQEALKLRRAFRTWDGLSYAAATLGVAGLGVHLWLSLRDTPGNEAEIRLIGVEGEIQALETQLQ